MLDHRRTLEQRPSVEFLSGIKQAGFALPEFVELERNAEHRLGKKVV